MTNKEILKEVLDIVNSVQSVKKHYILDNRLYVEFNNELLLYSTDIIKYHLSLIPEVSSVLNPEVRMNKKDGCYFEMKKYKYA